MLQYNMSDCPVIQRTEGTFSLLHCCFCSVWDCFASLTARLISVACGESWCRFGVRIQTVLRILHRDPVEFHVLHLASYFVLFCFVFTVYQFLANSWNLL